ncbi:hypothetical protein JCM9957A_49340 [Kineosporia succinea]|uniref:Uncharacterized protein n=1 Tax=Kineosporia succinea TaxID=84632 RepID=A0ABT9P9V2_9ACTN|nr:hypothetical protein [Kineosporia succinea]
MSATHTRTHVTVVFGDPFLACDQCGRRARGFHDPERCGCEEGFENDPCGHHAEVTSVCPSWTPVGGDDGHGACQCLEFLGRVDHPAVLA